MALREVVCFDKAGGPQVIHSPVNGPNQVCDFETIRLKWDGPSAVSVEAMEFQSAHA